jgi:hypothetical protein
LKTPGWKVQWVGGFGKPAAFIGCLTLRARRVQLDAFKMNNNARDYAGLISSTASFWVFLYANQ